jgi:hypothetical protein
MKIDLPIPAELNKQLTDTAESLHRIELLLRQLIIIESAKLTIDQRHAIEHQRNELLNQTLRSTA